MSLLIPLSRLKDNPWQTRQTYDQAYIEQELAPSIARSGLLQTPTGRLAGSDGKAVEVAPLLLLSQSSIDELLAKNPDWCVQTAFAHNRRRAFDFLFEKGEPVPGVKRAGHMPVELRLLDDEAMARQAWSENEQRRDLNPVERARAAEHRMTSFGWTQKQAADEMGLSRSRIANMLRLLKLPADVLGAVAAGGLSERAASALVPLFTQQEPLASAIRTYEAQDWTVGRKRTWKRHVVFEDLVEAATLGNLRSEEIRSRVERLMRGATVALGLVDPDHAYVRGSEPALRQEICAAGLGGKGCPLLVAVGEEKRCGDRLCHQEKAARAAGILLKAAHEETGLPITAEYDEQKTTTFSQYGSEQKLAHRLVRTGCPEGKLHIRLKDGHRGAAVPKHEKAGLVCVHASGGHCACLRPSGPSGKTAAQTAAAQDTKLGRARARLLGEDRYAAPAKASVFAALLALDPRAWNVALSIVESGTGTNWSYDYSYKQGKKGFFKAESGQELPALTFEDLCRRLADWTVSVETHHYGDCADSLHEVERFTRRRMKAMGLSFDEPDYGAVDIDAVADLATLSPSESAFDRVLKKAHPETLRDVVRRITDEAGKPTRGHKTRLGVIQARLADQAPEPDDKDAETRRTHREAVSTAEADDASDDEAAAWRKRLRRSTDWMTLVSATKASRKHVEDTLHELEVLKRDVARDEDPDLFQPQALLREIEEKTALLQAALEHNHAEDLTPAEVLETLPA